jgi:hypothetical protein
VAEKQSWLFCRLTFCKRNSFDNNSFTVVPTVKIALSNLVADKILNEISFTKISVRVIVSVIRLLMCLFTTPGVN